MEMGEGQAEQMETARGGGWASGKGVWLRGRGMESTWNPLGG